MNLSIQPVLLFIPNSGFTSIKSSVDLDYALSKLKRCLAMGKRVFDEIKSKKLRAVEIYIFYSNIQTDPDSHW